MDDAVYPADAARTLSGFRASSCTYVLLYSTTSLEGYRSELRIRDSFAFATRAKKTMEKLAAACQRPLRGRGDECTMARGDYTRSAKVEKAAALEAHWVMVRRARDYARGHKIGARATVSTWLFPGVTYSVLDNALKNKIKAVLGERYASDVLTKDEELKLVQWIVGSAHGKDPATDEEISEKVVLMLKARKADIRVRTDMCVRRNAVPDGGAQAVCHVRRHQAAALHQGCVRCSTAAAAAHDARGGRTGTGAPGTSRAASRRGTGGAGGADACAGCARHGRRGAGAHPRRARANGCTGAPTPRRS